MAAIFADDDGVGCVVTRVHIHFEVYPSLELATESANRIATSQVALPEAICSEVYATIGDESSRVLGRSRRSAWPATTSSLRTVVRSSSAP